MRNVYAASISRHLFWRDFEYISYKTSSILLSQYLLSYVLVILICGVLCIMWLNINEKCKLYVLLLCHYIYWFNTHLIIIIITFRSKTLPTKPVLLIAFNSYIFKYWMLLFYFVEKIKHSFYGIGYFDTYNTLTSSKYLYSCRCS